MASQLPPYASLPVERIWFYSFRVLVAAILFFLIFPILVIIPLSFNAQDFFTFTPEMLRLRPRGYSLKHYRISSPTRLAAGVLELGPDRADGDAHFGRPWARWRRSG
jgi:hypothetical protein